MNDQFMNDLKRLHGMGLAIHWLRPRSKIPINKGWATGERPSWAELKKTYREGYNVGCRLGEASKVKNGYLAVLDIDIKSDDPAHRILAEKWIEEKFPGLTISTVITVSGRGKGSGHLWMITKTPMNSYRLFASSETCIVHMPSVKATPDQIQKLGIKKIAEGYRIRPAFEIDFMSIGKQVVLPPSIHPDTKKKYTWKKGIQKIEDIKLVENLKQLTVLDKTSKSSTKEPIGDWSPVKIDDLETRLDSETFAMLTDGDNVSDRSVALLAVCKKLIKANFNDDEILTILTDPTTYLGQTAYDHTQSKSRKRAAQWIKNYCLPKAKEHLDPAKDFTDVSIDDSEPWKKDLDVTEHGKIRPSLKNIILIIKSIVGSDTFKKDDFSHIDMYGRQSPWTDKKPGDQINDIDITNIINWFAHQWGFEPTEQKINLAVQQIASENTFHPVKEYLDSLKWDKKSRVSGFLKNYFHADGSNVYLRAVSKKFLCAMVARIYKPGIKYDNVLILEGKQGVGKSTASRILGGEWFTDTGILNIGDKDSYLALQGKWLIELGELSSIRKTDLEKLKAYIAGQSDDLRPPYGRRSERFLRQSVFIGTTNADNYLNDPTGNRRFWPVKVSKCENELLKKDRDQLFAEAIHLFEAGEKLYLNEEENVIAEKEQKKRMVNEPWIEEFLEYVKNKADNDDFSFDEKSFTLKQLTDHPPFANVVNDQRDTKRISLVLRTLNYRSRSSNGKNLWELNVPKGNHL